MTESGRRRRSPRDGVAEGERGSASVWVAASAALVVLVAFAVTLGSSATLARHRAENAADLAALSAAKQIGLGADPCEWAGKVAAADGVSMAFCRADLSGDGRSGSVTVAVTRRVPLPITGWKTARAVSKAVRQPSARA